MIMSNMQRLDSSSTGTSANQDEENAASKKALTEIQFTQFSGWYNKEFAKKMNSNQSFNS